MLDFRSARQVLVVAAARTPIGKFGGALSSLTAVQLGTHAVRAALDRSEIDASRVDEVIFGHGRQAGCGPNPARQVGVGAGLPESTPAFTVNQACASGLKSIALGAQSIAMGAADVVVVGGMESMSNTPYLVPSARWGQRLGHTELVDGQYRDGFLCSLCGDLMGRTAERLAERYAIERTAQDAYAAESQQRAARARDEGRFDAEIAPIVVPSRKGDTTIARDEAIRDGVTVESLAGLKPVFKEGGTVHPGNSSGITDGAAALVLVAEDVAEKLGLRGRARLVAATQVGVDPAIMGIGPVPSVSELLEKTATTLADIDIIELNEAFAAQVLAVVHDLGIDQGRLNVNGGAIALGHPIGCTGSRIVVSLLHELERRGAATGLATLCVSGGMGSSLLIRRDGAG